MYNFLKKYILVYINILIYINIYLNNGLEDGFLYWGVMAIVKSWPLHGCQDERGWTPMVCAEEAGESEVGLLPIRGKTCARARKKICANPKMIKMIKDDWLGMRRKGHHRYFNIAPKSRSHHLQRG